MFCQSKLATEKLQKFYQEKILPSKAECFTKDLEIKEILKDIFQEVASQEPRFITNWQEGCDNDLFDLQEVGPNTFEILLFLNQMGVFNLIDDNKNPGCASLKLGDGRKRSMSLWVEFITASGFLSARKIRCRFKALVNTAIERTKHQDHVKINPKTTNVILELHGVYIVHILTAFRCVGIWPKSAISWPSIRSEWPNAQLLVKVKAEGFDLVSQEIRNTLKETEENGETVVEKEDSWIMNFTKAEKILLSDQPRQRCFMILETIITQYMSKACSDHPLNSNILKTLLLYECDKHPEWKDTDLGDRLVGILIQLVSCLQSRHCPHYFISDLDLMQGLPNCLLDKTAVAIWNLVRQLIVNPRCLEQL